MRRFALVPNHGWRCTPATLSLVRLARREKSVRGSRPSRSSSIRHSFARRPRILHLPPAPSTPIVAAICVKRRPIWVWAPALGRRDVFRRDLRHAWVPAGPAAAGPRGTRSRPDFFCGASRRWVAKLFTQGSRPDVAVFGGEGFTSSSRFVAPHGARDLDLPLEGQRRREPCAEKDGLAMSSRKTCTSQPMSAPPRPVAASGAHAVREEGKIAEGHSGRDHPVGRPARQSCVPASYWITLEARPRPRRLPPIASVKDGADQVCWSRR